MSTILMSIKPIYVEKIFSEKKKYEYRKRICKNKIDKIIVYSTSPVKKIVGELIIKRVIHDNKEIVWNKTYKYSGVDKNRFDKYFENSEDAFAFEIEKVIKYEPYKDLSDYNIKVAPQSFIYINDKI